jgi:glutamine phosphoribosylpyrophosphate amidotransferase
MPSTRLLRADPRRDPVGTGAGIPGIGASEVHLRISAPPICHPCHYGVDISSREETIAHERTIEKVADELGASR